MDDGLESLYAWVDTVPLSRPKRTFTRDFADGGACWGGSGDQWAKVGARGLG